MTSVFRKAYEEHIDDGSLSSQLVRSSLLAADAAFYPGRRAYLSVRIVGAEAEAYLANQVATSVLDSTAYFAKAIGNTAQGDNTVRLTPLFRKKVGMRNAGSVGNRLLFKIEPRHETLQAPLVDESQLVTLGEKSAQSLTLALPEDDRDERSLENALALTPTERQGLGNLAETLDRFGRSIEMGLSVGGKVTSSGVLTSAQAKILDEHLKAVEPKSWDTNFVGKLDGIRSSRRQFFLILDSGEEVQGTISADLLPLLPSYINKRVTVGVHCFQPVYGNGRKGRTTYRLDSVDQLVGGYN